MLSSRYETEIQETDLLACLLARLFLCLHARVASPDFLNLQLPCRVYHLLHEAKVSMRSLVTSRAYKRRIDQRFAITVQTQFTSSKVKAAGDMDQLISAHEEFLATIIKRSLLDNNSANILNQLRILLDQINKFQNIQVLVAR